MTNPHACNRPFTRIMSALVLLLFALTLHSAEPSYKQFTGYQIHYSAFNSSFIQPNIASTYNIVRGKDKGMINIAVVDAGASHGRAAQVSGYVSNIFAQQQFLKFFEVREGDAVYYLAPFEFENEDPLTFKIEVSAQADKPSESISFQRTFYHEE